MRLEGLAVGLEAALLQGLLNAGVLAAVGCSQQGRHPVLVRRDVIDDGARLDMPGPAHELGHTEAAFARQALLATERVHAAHFRGGHDFRAVVGGPEHDGVVGNAQLIELVEQLARFPVQFVHGIGEHALAGLAVLLLAQMNPDVAAGRVEPHEEGLLSVCVLVRFDRTIHEIEGPGGDVLLDGFHAFDRQRAGVFAFLLTDHAPARLYGIVDRIRRHAVHHAAGAERCPEILAVKCLRIVRILRLLLGVQVVEVAVELVEAANRGQVLVQVAQMVLAELGR